MKKALVLGAGFTSKPLVDYLLKQKDVEVTVTGLTVREAEKVTEKRPGSVAVALDLRDKKHFSALVADSDVAISLLPYEFHVKAAQKCIEARRPLVTTSYAKDEIYQLDAEARANGVLILKEMGLDPGIDHMSAMRIFDRIRERRGKVVSFKSSCGGVPAPEADNNPLHYKFSWSPKGVLLAAKSDVQFVEDGVKKSFSGRDLEKCTETLAFDGFSLESYPNRDSLPYLEFYKIPEAKTIQRATLRYRGWSAFMSELNRLGFLDEGGREFAAGASWREITQSILNQSPNGAIQPETLKNLEWLGLFDDAKKIKSSLETNPIDFLTQAMVEKMQYAPEERDMIVLNHEIIADYGGRLEKITARLIAYGEPGKYSAMAKTVALPAAVAANKILRGEFSLAGVQIPVIPQIYNPVLDELDALGIRFEESTEQIQGAS